MCDADTIRNYSCLATVHSSTGFKTLAISIKALLRYGVSLHQFYVFKGKSSFMRRRISSIIWVNIVSDIGILFVKIYAKVGPHFVHVYFYVANIPFQVAVGKCTCVFVVYSLIIAIYLYILPKSPALFVIGRICNG